MRSPFSHVRLFETLWIRARQAPLSMGFSRQEYWSELPCPPSGDLPDPGSEPTSLKSPALAGRFFTTSASWKHQKYHGRAELGHELITQSLPSKPWVPTQSLLLPVTSWVSAVCSYLCPHPCFWFPASMPSPGSPAVALPPLAPFKLKKY